MLFSIPHDIHDIHDIVRVAPKLRGKKPRLILGSSEKKCDHSMDPDEAQLLQSLRRPQLQSLQLKRLRNHLTNQNAQIIQMSIVGIRPLFLKK